MEKQKEGDKPASQISVDALVIGKAREIAEIITAEPKYPLSADMIESYIMGYAKDVARKQRKICAEHYKQEHWKAGMSNSDDLILNAPEPEL